MEDPGVETCSVTIGEDPYEKETPIPCGDSQVEPQDGVEQDQGDSKSTNTLSTEETCDSLSMPFDQALLSLDLDLVVLPIAIYRVVITLYSCFIVGVLLAAGTPTRKMFGQASAVVDVLAPNKVSISNNDTNVQFRDIDSVDAIYDWISDTFIPRLFVSTDYKGEPLREDQRGRVGQFNVVLGGVIFEMTPWKFEYCLDEFYYVDIYPYCTDPDSNGETQVTYLETGLSNEEAATVISDLKSNGTWVNDDTRQLVVTVVTYNADIDGYFTVTRFTIRFTSSGALDVGATVVSVPDFKGTNTVCLITGIGIGCMAVIWFMWRAEKLTAAPSNDPSAGSYRDIIRSITPWQVLLPFVKFGAVLGFVIPWIVVTRANFTSTMEAFAESKTQDEEYRIDALLTVIEDLDSAARWMEALSILGALAIAQLGVYCIRQLRFHPQLNVFARTVAGALKQFKNFFFVFIIIFITFSFAGNVLFGHRVREFSSGYLSMQACINMLFGEFEYDSIKSFRGAGFFFWGYMIVVSVILLNMMLAIVMGTYEVMSKEGYDGQESVLLMGRLSKLYQNHKTCIDEKHPCRTKPSEDDKGALAEFETYRMNLRKLVHEDAVMFGKIRPMLLRGLLNTKWTQLCEVGKAESGESSAVSTVQLTPSILRELLPAAQITDSEICATFQFLREGLIVHKAVVKLPKRKGIRQEDKLGGKSNKTTRGSFVKHSEITVQPVDLSFCKLNPQLKNSTKKVS